jgi:hypothetical protein
LSRMYGRITETKRGYARQNCNTRNYRFRSGKRKVVNRDETINIVAVLTVN